MGLVQSIQNCIRVQHDPYLRIWVGVGFTGLVFHRYGSGVRSSLFLQYVKTRRVEQNVVPVVTGVQLWGKRPKKITYNASIIREKL
jgi:hypothetical protein